MCRSVSQLLCLDSHYQRGRESDRISVPSSYLCYLRYFHMLFPVALLISLVWFQKLKCQDGAIMASYWRQAGASAGQYRSGITQAPGGPPQGGRQENEVGKLKIAGFG